MPPYCSCGVTLVSVSPDIQIPLEAVSFTPSEPWLMCLVPPAFTYYSVSEWLSTFFLNSVKGRKDTTLHIRFLK